MIRATTQSLLCCWSLLIPALPVAAATVDGIEDAFPSTELPATAALPAKEALTTELPATEPPVLDPVALESARAKVAALGATSGPALSEAYLGLATTMQSMALHTEAVEAFGNSLQALRISEGLQNLRQLPILQGQLASLQALENWEAVDATHHLIFHITQKTLAAGAETRLAALMALAQWKARLSTDQLLSSFQDSAIEAVNLYENEIVAIVAAAPYASKNIQLGNLYLALAEIELVQAKSTFSKPLTAFDSGQQRSVSKLECQILRMPNGASSQVCTNVEVPNMEYYLAPNRAKNREILNHLEKMKEVVLEAYNVVQTESPTSAQRVHILTEVQRLTTLHNEFVNAPE
jgi:hypothetical protein